MLQAGRLGALPSRVLVVAHVRAQATCFCRLHLHNSPAAMVQAQDAVHCSIKARQSPITACASASATATEQVVPLTDADLKRYAQQHGIIIEFMANSKPISDPDTVKSLVFMANGQPVMVVVAGPDKVEERKVADHLGVARRRVRLATQQEALQASGFAVGTVAPFGHPQPLRTIVDVSVTRHARVYCGSGKADVDVGVAVADMLQHTRAEVVDVAVGARPSVEAKLQEAAALLPLPWPPGAEMVRMIGVVAQRRRIAKLLLFSVLVPETVPALPEQASYMRRLWRSPATGGPLEVQLIMGKTLERSLGREAAIQLMDRIKSGCIVSVVGRVQPNLGPGGSTRPDVMDVVCHHVEVLHKNRDVLERALRKARRAGHKHVSTAEDLQQLALLGHAFDDMLATTSSSDEGSGSDGEVADGAGAGGSSDGAGVVGSISSTRPSVSDTADSLRQAAAMLGGSGADAECWALPLPVEAIQVVEDLAGLRSMHREVLGCGADGGSSSESSNGGGGAAGSIGSPQEAEPTAAQAPVASGAAAGAAPSEAEAAPSAAGTVAGAAAEAAAGEAALPVVCGIDCEWEPFERGQPKTPVALLQLAFRGQVYLVDLLQICQAGRGEDADVSSLSDTELAFSEFFGQLMASEQVFKLGFQLGSDLDRLQESYPSLPCFRADQGPSTAAAGAGAGAATTAGSSSGSGSSSANGDGSSNSSSSSASGTIRGHVDIIQLARALHPRLENLAHTSLSRLVAAVLGKPLDKAQQRSSWAQRPLRPEQLLYAAADASCLVALFDELIREYPGARGEQFLATMDNGLRRLPGPE